MATGVVTTGKTGYRNTPVETTADTGSGWSRNDVQDPTPGPRAKHGKKVRVFREGVTTRFV